MIILAHSGYWQEKSEQNQRAAFARSFNAGYGVETDLRDYCGRIVVSHDMPKGDEMSFEELLRSMNERNLCLALNIKADGLADLIRDLLESYHHTNYFCLICQFHRCVIIHTSGLKLLPGFLIYSSIRFCLLNATAYGLTLLPEIGLMRTRSTH